MPDLNRATLIGSIATDPIMRMAGDKPVCNFRLATNRWNKEQKTAEFHSIVCWDRVAENVGSFLSKGSRIFVEGRLQTREWVAVDGQNKRTTEIVADQIIFLDKPDKPARSTESVTNLSTESFVLNSMDKSDNIQDIRIEDVPF